MGRACGVERVLVAGRRREVNEPKGRVLPGRAWGVGSAFRCYRCGQNKHTQGRKRIVIRGVPVWVCAECIEARAKEKAA